MSLTYPRLHRDVDFFDFIVFRWAVLEWPGLAEALMKNRYRIFVDIWSSLYFEKREADAERAFWTAQLMPITNADESVDRLLNVLCRLFPTIEGSLRLRGNTESLEVVRARRGIGHPEYFERYFGLSVPSEELTESDFLAGMNQVVVGSAFGDNESANRLAASLVTDSNRIAPRIEQWVKDNPGTNAVVARWTLPYVKQGNDTELISSYRLLRGLVLRIVMSSSNRVELASTLLHALDDVVATARLAMDLLKEGGMTSQEQLTLRTAASARIMTEVSRLSEPPLNGSDDYWVLLSLWARIDEPSV
ncbi:hypothetical protein ACFVUP_38785, partial [Streptomyces bacillaris]|uniref:hypothetical protein n=1 Tax=Streptomyces bacillaris TaxID=68179 RepID=UPI0036DA52A3